jgi:hypothetical protein
MKKVASSDLWSQNRHWPDAYALEWRWVILSEEYELWRSSFSSLLELPITSSQLGQITSNLQLTSCAISRLRMRSRSVVEFHGTKSWDRQNLQVAAPTHHETKHLRRSPVSDKINTWMVPLASLLHLDDISEQRWNKWWVQKWRK